MSTPSTKNPDGFLGKLSNSTDATVHTHVQTHCGVTNQLTRVCSQDQWLLVAGTISYRDNTSLGTKPGPSLCHRSHLLNIDALNTGSGHSNLHIQQPADAALYRRNHRQELQANKVTVEPWGSLLVIWITGVEGGGLINHRSVPLIRNAPE